jgi:mannose-6-phosphate isomerase-like protein (cupin superfamily)
LSDSKSEGAVNINIAKLAGDDSFALYVTEIPSRCEVGAHFHLEGLETYQILSGRGRMFIGHPFSDHSIKWQKPVEVESGDFFTIPKGMAHQLKNPYDESLILVFGCPSTHLNDDRMIVEKHRELTPTPIKTNSAEATYPLEI